jgi:hypothetical protein
LGQRRRRWGAVGARVSDDGGVDERRSTRAELVVVPVGVRGWPDEAVHGEVLLAEEAATQGGLRSAPSYDQQFGEEVQVQATLEEVALALPDRWWLARKCAALQQWQATREVRSDRGVTSGENQTGFAPLSMLASDKD